ncbi:bifunctional glutamate N-acetyltransferase/amino-acid acetyltransferase ArgJ [Anthropogastromicrobium aceti]|uniref:Arginine biosynthesis bifunctional protein ArgJ n=1 Tax=Anthropogastromicrobium aceti TaxID=2981768 RepID=A0AAE3E6N5_9FIRM|nr:bifunctional glutamate N-acetyltransferase/amino-acid acetyltransferase ArgJ [Anthropogastromicrobium aceti]MCC2222302.1 bifunctional glutamate N-acetyltransferase/amino-acid acetyltransferase ArgJ [Anthropogastromicrobium aceti]
MAITKINGGVTAPKGFLASGLNAGIKNQTKKDMAMVFSSTPCAAAGVFTTNLVKAAPVKWDKELVTTSPYVQAVVVNSGIANACTGAEGLGYCADTAAEAAAALNIPKTAVLVASTGVIGKQLPIDKIKSGVTALSKVLGSSREDAKLAAEAIMTTDTKSKEVACTLELDGKQVTVAGMCKGSGMIHPNMCTMLCFVTTDVAISHELLQKALSEDVVDTFNMISVDGDTSTNDTVLVMANGQAENTPITKEGEDYKTFCEALHFIMLELSKKIAGDGEGCTCLFEATVIGAKDKNQARTIAKSVVCSSLTKAAVFGHDANWGRILCAMGYSGAQFDPEVVDIWLESKAGTIKIVENGIATDYSEETATKILSEEEVIAKMDIKEGNETATAFGCDLTYEYVKINGDYRS